MTNYEQDECHLVLYSYAAFYAPIPMIISPVEERRKSGTQRSPAM